MGESRRIEMVIGENIRKMRSRQDISQAELGEKLGEILGTTWSRSTVSQAEAGKRSFVAVELVALAVVFGSSIQSLFRHHSGEAVQVSDAYTLSGHKLDSLTLSLNDPMLMRAFALVRQTLSDQEQLHDSVAELSAKSRQLTKEAIDTLTFMHPSELKGDDDA